MSLFGFGINPFLEGWDDISRNYEDLTLLKAELNLNHSI